MQAKERIEEHAGWLPAPAGRKLMLILLADLGFVATGDDTGTTPGMSF